MRCPGMMRIGANNMTRIGSSGDDDVDDFNIDDTEGICFVYQLFASVSCTIIGLCQYFDDSKND